MMMLVLLDHKHCNKMRIVENTLSTRRLIKVFASMCGVELADGYIDFLFNDKTKTVFEFSDESGKLLEIRREPFSTRF